MNELEKLKQENLLLKKEIERLKKVIEVLTEEKETAERTAGWFFLT